MGRERFGWMTAPITVTYPPEGDTNGLLIDERGVWPEIPADLNNLWESDDD